MLPRLLFTYLLICTLSLVLTFQPSLQRRPAFKLQPNYAARPSPQGIAPLFMSVTSETEVKNTVTLPPDLKSRSLLFTVLASLAVAISYADRSNLSTAIIPMAQVFKWDSFFSGLVLSSFWLGYGTTQVLGGRVADKIGGEKLLVGAMLIWSVCTGLTPMAASSGPAALLLIRVALGAGEGLALPAIHSMVNTYVPVQKRSSSAATITAACYGGALAANLIAPSLVDSKGWEACFYLFAAIPSLVWLPLWLAFIQTAKPASAATARSSSSPPIDGTIGRSMTLKELVASPPVWGIMLSQYGQGWGMIGLLSWLPTYYSQNFNVPLTNLASFTALPFLLQMTCAISAGGLADIMIEKTKMTVISIRSIFQLLGTLVPAFCLFLCAYPIGGAQLTAGNAEMLITIGSAFSALTVAAVSCNHFDISPKNAGTIFAMGNTASCVGGLIAVPVAGYIYDSTASWDLVFLLFALHYIGGAAAWLKFASDKRIDGSEAL